ncbi:unnamed protein product, partial [Tetraodon nigroviridis]
GEQSRGSYRWKEGKPSGEQSRGSYRWKEGKPSVALIK